VLYVKGDEAHAAANEPLRKTLMVDEDFGVQVDGSSLKLTDSQDRTFVFTRAADGKGLDCPECSELPKRWEFWKEKP
jgi:hypothetical protein